MITIIILFGCLVLWSIFGIVWVNRCHKKYVRYINKPWADWISELKTTSIFDNKKEMLFVNRAETAIKEMKKMSPIYFIKHWNDVYNEEWYLKKIKGG